MQFKFVAAAACALLTMAACGQAPSKPVEGPKETVKPAISEEARNALAQAEADVANAQAQFALWTSAESALKQARQAAQAGISATVIQQSAIAGEQAKLGLAQLSYPTTEPQ